MFFDIDNHYQLVYSQNQVLHLNLSPGESAMRRVVYSLLILTSSFSNIGRASTPNQDVEELLKDMSGCFRVTFNYVEDGEHDAFYEPVYEKAEILSSDPLTIERTLIIAGNAQRHWSEKWTEVNESTWRQEVIGPFGDFRYKCDGKWVKNQWSCVAEHAPKPRRDAARPYATLTRKNTLQINTKRWIHAQANTKWTNAGEVYSVELGWNSYERVVDSLCLGSEI